MVISWASLPVVQEEVVRVAKLAFQEAPMAALARWVKMVTVRRGKRLLLAACSAS